jgi:hypothetical protein
MTIVEMTAVVKKIAMYDAKWEKQVVRDEMYISGIELGALRGDESILEGRSGRVQA